MLSIRCSAPTKMFFPLLKTVFELFDFDSFGFCHCFFCFLFFVFVFCITSSTLAKRFLLRTFFISRNKKICLRRDQVNREHGAWGYAVLGPKLLNTQCSVGRCAPKLPIMKKANALSLQKNFSEAKRSLSQQCQVVH